ncbi:MAG: hypothetical protein HY747_08790, partial [Elusimicrobia bacterium]|nr:hypothetical protein [Elusimicrobiota bacterium]
MFASHNNSGKNFFTRLLSLLLSFLLVLELIPSQALAAVKGDGEAKLAAVKGDGEAKAVEISSQELNTSEENQAQALLQNIFEGAGVRSSFVTSHGDVTNEDLTPVPSSAAGGNTPQSTKSAQAGPFGESFGTDPMLPHPQRARPVPNAATTPSPSTSHTEFHIPTCEDQHSYEQCEQMRRQEAAERRADEQGFNDTIDGYGIGASFISVAAFVGAVITACLSLWTA